MKADTRDYTVIMAYTGECCGDSHVWAKHLRTRNMRRAVAAMRKRVEREGNEPHDCVVYHGHIQLPEVVTRREEA